MKYLSRVVAFHTFSLWLTSQMLPSLTISGDWQTVLLSGAILAALSLVVAPLLKILFIPINILTFGLLSWFVNVTLLYLLTLLVPAVSVRAFRFPGGSWGGASVGAFDVGYPLALILTSVILTGLTNALHWSAD